MKLTASQIDLVKCQLEAELEAGQSAMVALREENQHIRQILEGIRTRALSLGEGINDVCRVLESLEAQASNASLLSTAVVE